MQAFTETKEFYELVKDFEKIFSSERLDKEPKELHKSQVFYQDGNVNKMFIAFMHGYQVGRIAYM